MQMNFENIIGPKQHIKRILQNLAKLNSRDSVNTYNIRPELLINTDDHLECIIVGTIRVSDDARINAGKTFEIRLLLNNDYQSYILYGPDVFVKPLENFTQEEVLRNGFIEPTVDCNLHPYLFSSQDRLYKQSLAFKIGYKLSIIDSVTYYTNILQQQNDQGVQLHQFWRETKGFDPLDPDREIMQTGWLNWAHGMFTIVDHSEYEEIFNIIKYTLSTGNYTNIMEAGNNNRYIRSKKYKNRAYKISKKQKK